ncbi:MAG: hypothetical protein QF464_20695, partial [Myxococcota bacterium]|nr:hypothetical protein [Myxococcota bacterium]
MCRLDIKSAYIFIDVEGSSYQIGFGALVDFWPCDHPKLTGSVEMFVDMVAMTIGATMWIDGQWREPFGFTNFVVEDPALTFDLKVATYPPIPNSFGATIDMYWVKDGDFPGWEDPVVPGDNTVYLGFGFYFEVEPTPSGLCSPSGGCLPLPTLHARLQAENLNFPADVIGISIAAINATTDMFGGFIPNIPMPELDFSPFEIDIHELKLLANTHDLDFFGVSYTPGFEFVFDAEVFGLEVEMRGYLGPENLELYAEVAPFTLLGITFTGNPFEGVAELGDTGYIRTPHDGKFNSPTFTVEGHVLRNHWVGGDNAGVLVKKMDGNNGFQVAVGDVDQDNGKGKVTVTIRNNGETRILKTTKAVVEPMVVTHIAATFDNSGANDPDGPGSAFPVAVYVDGRWTRLEEVEGPD